MRKVTVRLPATISSIGPGLNALALGLYTSVEISERHDNQLLVEPSGEGAGHYSVGLRHPVTLAMMRVFQRIERTAPGIQIRINNTIPLESGLGAETAFAVAGVIGASNLLGQNLSREDILQLSTHISPQPQNVMSALLGGLSAGVLQNDTMLYRSLPVKPFQVVVVAPHLDGYRQRIPQVPKTVPLPDVEHHLNRIPLLLEGFRTGDVALISQMLEDHIWKSRLQIPGYNHVRETARLAGALAVTICGDGPALLALAAEGHSRIAEAMVAAFQNAGVEAAAHVVSIDTQGVVISAVQ